MRLWLPDQSEPQGRASHMVHMRGVGRIGRGEIKWSMGQGRSTVAWGGMSGRTAQRDGGYQAAVRVLDTQCFENTVKGDMLGLHFVEGYRKFPDREDSGPTTSWGSHFPVSLKIS